MSNNIIDGEPITYDFLQGLAKRVTDLEEKTNNNQNSKPSQNISVVGRSLTKAGKITILCGSFEFDINQKSSYPFKVDFDGSNFSAAPHVVATISDTPDSRKDDNVNMPYATVTIGDVTQKGFRFRVELIKASAKNTKIKVNYIAIGQAGK